MEAAALASLSSDFRVRLCTCPPGRAVRISHLVFSSTLNAAKALPRQLNFPTASANQIQMAQVVLLGQFVPPVLHRQQQPLPRARQQQPLPPPRHPLRRSQPERSSCHCFWANPKIVCRAAQVPFHSSSPTMPRLTPALILRPNRPTSSLPSHLKHKRYAFLTLSSATCPSMLLRPTFTAPVPMPHPAATGPSCIPYALRAPPVQVTPRPFLVSL